MKSKTDWNEEGFGTNSSGFSALPGGNRFSNGSFGSIGKLGYWWSSTESVTLNAWFRYLSYADGDVYRYNLDKDVGFSVRCLRD